MPTGNSTAVDYLVHYYNESESNAKKIQKLFKGKKEEDYEEIVEQWIRDQCEKRKKSKDYFFHILMSNMLGDFGYEDFDFYYQTINEMLGRKPQENDDD